MLSWLRYVPSTLTKYKYIPYIAASVDVTGLEQLRESPDALAISVNDPLHLALPQSLPRIGAPRAWAGGFNGTGKTVAALDSGYLYSDGGARLWVNNRLEIDRRLPSSEPQTRGAPVELKAGEKADLRVEYYNGGGKTAIYLLCNSASTPRQVIPQLKRI